MLRGLPETILGSSGRCRVARSGQPSVCYRPEPSARAADASSLVLILTRLSFTAAGDLRLEDADGAQSGTYSPPPRVAAHAVPQHQRTPGEALVN
jgi:hypothetical protein